MKHWLIYFVLCMMACDRIPMDRSYALSIPPIYIEEGDPRLSLSIDGTWLLDRAQFSGFMTSHYPQGNLRSSKAFMHGRQEDTAYVYYPGGQLFSKRPYRHGEKHGEHVGFYEEGQIKFQYSFVDGLGQGIHREWYKDGTLHKQLTYQDGHELGTQQVWRPDGKLRSNYVVRENGRKYGLLGVKRCAKIDSNTGDIDPYKGALQ